MVNQPFLSGAGQFYTDPTTGQQYWVQGNQAFPIAAQGLPALPGSGPPELPTEKRDMPVVGYRGWKWETKFRLGLGTRGHLASHAMGPGWNGTTETAACLNERRFSHPGPAPDPNCGCGLYVIANLDELDAHITVNDTMIVGAVLGWGRVVQHGREGWRAQFARILALLDCKFSEAQLKNTREAAKEYKVPLLQRDGLERYVAEWGDPFAEPKAEEPVTP
jgi:hypothetical protein